MAGKSWSELLAAHSEELASLSEADGTFLEADTALAPWVKYLLAM
jgi:hypothetical protein